MLISIIGWMVLGLIAGFIGSKVVNLRGDDPNLGIGLGAIGAVLGGWIYSWISGAEVGGFNFRSLMVAGLVAVVVLASWHTWRRMSTT